MKNMGILLRVGALLFSFAFLLIKNRSRMFETGTVGLVETQLFFYANPFFFFFFIENVSSLLITGEQHNTPNAPPMKYCMCFYNKPKKQWD